MPTRAIRFSLAALAVTIALASGGTAQASVPGTQTVSAVVAASAGVQVAADGRIGAPTATTPVSVTRRRAGDAVIVTVVPGT